MKKGLGVLLGVCCFLMTQVATAGVEFEEVAVWNVELADGVSASARLLVDEEGAAFLTTSSQSAAYVYRVGPEGALQEISYQYNGETPVEPVSFGFGPDGDLLVRGNAMEVGSEPLGVTARLTREGELVWETPDFDFYEEDDYIGVYQQAVGPVVWSEAAQRLLVFSESSFEIAPVSQGTMIRGIDGLVRDASVTFGDQYIGAELNNALLTPNKRFLIYYFSTNDRGTRFFEYDGASNISFFRPEGGDWTSRVVHSVEYDVNKNLVLLWSDLVDESDAAKSKLTKLDPEGKLLWETDLSGSIPVTVADPETGLAVEVQGDLLRPVFMVVGEREIVLLRQAGQEHFLFDVRSSEDGTPLGFSDFFALTENSVFDLKYLPGTDRNYLVSTANSNNPSVNEVLQIQLKLNDAPVLIGDPDGEPENNGVTDPENNGPLVDPDAEPENPPSIPEVGCGCETPGKRAPVQGPALWLVVLAGLGLAVRNILNKEHT